MGEKNLSQKVLESIKAKHIQPIPKWEFLLKSYTIWTLFGLGIIFGSIATSIILFIALSSHLPEDLTFYQKIILTLPYFWIAILAVFTFIAYYNFRNIKQGYRHNPYLVLIMSVLISVVAGSTIYASGGAEKLEEVFYAHLPLYQRIMHQEGKMLVDSEYGRIAGLAEKVELRSFLVRDFYGRLWIVTYPTTTPKIHVGNRLIIYGKKLSDNEFKAEIIRTLYSRNGAIERLIKEHERNK